MANSKQKGSSFERTVANMLTKAFGDKFHRTAHSGAFTGGHNSHRASELGSATKAFLGDIIPPDGYNVVVECKNYSNISFYQIMQGECRQLDEWLREVKFDSKGGVHLLVFKIDYSGVFMCFPEEHFKDIRSVNEEITYTNYVDEDGKDYIIINDGYIDLIQDYIKSVIKPQEN